MEKTRSFQRIVPRIPERGAMRLLIDSDVANEIDDLYALALAFASPDRFTIEGLVASHFAGRAGRESIAQSYDLLMDLLTASDLSGRYRTAAGSEPMRYPGTPEPSEGVDLIVERARLASEDDPLWIVCLGVATDLASALLFAPEIAPKVRLVFHARSEATWPKRSVQFNVYGDILAAKTILESSAPLVWFDTGTHLYTDMETTRTKLAPLGGIGKFLHEYRFRDPWFQQPDKGMFDVGDIAYLIEPFVCTSETVPAPGMTRWMEFEHDDNWGAMVRASDIDAERTWEIFYDRMRKTFG